MLQRQVKHHRSVLQEVEARASDPRAGFEIKQMMLFAERQVIFWYELEFSNRCFAIGTPCLGVEMAEEEQSRSEKATPWKLRQARGKGAVPKGMDLSSLLALAVFAGTLAISGPAIFNGMLRLFAAGLWQSGVGLSPSGTSRLATGMLGAELRLWAGPAVLLMAAGSIF